MSERNAKAWAPWLGIAVLGFLWALSIYELDGAVCGLHSPFPRWCLSLNIALVVIPLLMAGVLGFILGRRFGRRETTRGIEHEF